MDAYELDAIEQRGGAAFAAMVHGLPSDPIDPASKLRRAVIAAVAFAWAQNRIRAEEVYHAVALRVAEAKRLEKEHAEWRRADTEAGRALSFVAEKTNADEKRRIEAALRDAQSNLIGVEEALEWVAGIERFDPAAARALVGLPRWRADQVDQNTVDRVRGEIGSELTQLAEKLS